MRFLKKFFFRSIIAIIMIIAFDIISPPIIVWVNVLGRDMENVRKEAILFSSEKNSKYGIYPVEDRYPTIRSMADMITYNNHGVFFTIYEGFMDSYGFLVPIDKSDVAKSFATSTKEYAPGIFLWSSLY